jgi:hypothetical protein
MIVRRIVRSRVTHWILVAPVVGLLGCPQLLDDSFSTGRLLQGDSGPLCQDGDCAVTHSAGAGGEVALEQSAGASGASGTAGTSAGGAAGTGVSGSSGSAGTTGSGGSAGTAGSAGAAGSAGSAGADGTPDAGGSAGQGGSAGSGSGLACWTLELTDGTQDSSNSCLGIVGGNSVEADTGTSLSLSYQNGDPCFSGTVASTGWGAVYIFEFANSGTWNASAAGVTGFSFASRGANPPASLNVYYKDPDGEDYCRTIAPGETAVPFANTHPDCSTNAASATVDPTQMDELILAFLPRSPAYAVNFCLQITALD